MKKITFILLALISGTAFAQEASAIVNAEIVSPLEIVSSEDLNFGTINGTSTGGDVTVALTGQRTFDNPDMEVSSSTPVGVAIFSITAADGYVYSIDIPDAVLTGGGATGTDGLNMPVTFIHNRNSAARRTGDGVAQDLRVGGTLTVNDGQVAGAYAGEVTVTVSYE